MIRGSLRGRLLVGVVALVALALGAFGFTTVALLRSYLLDRVDTQLLDTQRSFTRGGRGSAFDPDHDGDGRGGPNRAGRYGASSFSLQVFDADGVPQLREPSGFRDDPDPEPDLPPLPFAAAAGYPDPFTVGAIGNPGFRYRVLVTPNAATRSTLVMAVPINEDDETIGRLVAVEVALAVVVLATVAILGWRAMGVGLRPLDDMTETATAIAGGDLSHRVDVSPDDRTDEVGRLGRALNGMLSQIEAAFRTKEVSEDQLRQFVADASHELRTPLTSIRGYAELYRRGALRSDDAVSDAMRRIEDESARMGQLVDDLLLLARLDQGRPLEQQPVDLAALAADAVRDCRAVAPERPIELGGDPEVVVIGDPARLHQVVANLLDNARVHTPPTTPVSVWVGPADGDTGDAAAGTTDAGTATGGPSPTTPGDAPGSGPATPSATTSGGAPGGTAGPDGPAAEIRVHDDGPGLSPDVAARVFERSFRGEAAGRVHAGSGLGLSIVAAIAEAHGGRARVESRPGGGTTFIVRLPVGGARTRPANTAPPAPAAPIGS